jgi:hypothetical protein
MDNFLAELLTSTKKKYSKTIIMLLIITIIAIKLRKYFLQV